VSKKHFSWLVAVTVLAAVVAFLLPRQTARNGEFQAVEALPELAAVVNEVDWLRVSGGDGTIATLERRGGQWVVVEANAYPAAWPALQRLLSDLAAAEVVEVKTANPAYYDRLGVEDPAAGSPGLVLAFRESAGLPSVIVGKRAQARGGQYLRRTDSERSVLIDRELEVPGERVDWLDRRVVDVSRDEVVEVAIQHADGESILARKISADDENFSLEGVAEGYEPRSAWTVDSLANALESLDLEAVVPADGIDWEGATLYRVVTAGGLDLAARVVGRPGEEDTETDYWLALEAGLYTTSLDQEVDDAGREASAERAAEINRRVSGWAYSIPKFNHDAMNKRMADLVQEIADEK
jgi:hypothetical protein